jgi:hypothetical protein
MRIEKYLEEVKRQKGFKRDKDLAEWLGVTAAAISQYKSGARSIEDNEQCIKIALALDIHPNQVIMAADMDRAERTGQKSLWEVFLARTATATSAALLKGILVVAFVTNFLTPHPAEASTTRVTACQIGNSTNYAKLICKNATLFQLLMW